ncbi:MAG: hypothetical protein KTR35_16180 [Gammaproteobacteria bacterium]|nr:hypothetical protein [Gammaproteobacteria bacterium]
MEYQVPTFIDNYFEASSTHSTFEDLSDQILDVEELEDEGTPWSSFCDTADAWARQAQASNGFGGF